MVDVVSQEVRSRMMAGIRGKNTKPEIALRKGLHAAGFRFRLHDQKLPGKPDIVLARYKAVVFIHGCFWHGHECGLFKWPSTREEFWRAKIASNRKRDTQTATLLVEGGWRILTVWECAIRGRDKIGIEKVVRQAGEWLRTDAATDEIRGKEGKYL